MAESNPFSFQSPQKAFLIGLAGSTMDSFYKQHAQKQAEEQQAKKTDYDILMTALKARVDSGNITPSEVNEIMQRAVDIFKPKGHQDVKARLSEMFGGGKPYQMQSAGIMKDAQAKPRLQVAGQMPGGTEQVPMGNEQVTMPKPPSFHPEFTLREQDIADKEKFARMQADAIAKRQADDDERQRVQHATDIEQRKNAAFENASKILGLRMDAAAKANLRKEAVNRYGNDSPEALNQTIQELRGERDTKNAYMKARAERAGIQARREDELIDARILYLNNQIGIQSGKAGIDYFKNEADALKGQIQIAEGNRTSALREKAIAASTFDDAGVAKAQAKIDEIQGKIDGLNEKLETRAVEAAEMKQNRVTLPSAPGKKGQRKFTEEYIRSRGGTDADVQEAKDKHRLVGFP